MKNGFLCIALVAFVFAVSAKSEYFSDTSEEEYRKLQEIARYLKERIERVEAAEDALEVDTEPEPPIQSSRNYLNPPFVYTLPNDPPKADEVDTFAYSPSDPRFYQQYEYPVSAPEEPSSSTTKKKRPEGTKKVLSSLSNEVPMVSDNKNPFHSGVRQVPVTTSLYDEEGRADIYFTAIVAGCSAAAVVAVVAIGIGCYRLQKNAKAAAEVDYPAYGVTGPNKDVSPGSGDRRLAQSAQMYHYQHQKQQIIAMESMNNKERRNSISDAESEEENEEGDYTVYECPGLASTGEMEVKNPLFQDDQTPATKPTNDSSEESRDLPK